MTSSAEGAAADGRHDFDCIFGTWDMDFTRTRS